jgi:type IV pilus assembly protein PilW
MKTRPTENRITGGLMMRSQRGLGLIELMIAVTIGLVLIAGALSVFVNSRASYRTNQSIGRLLENGNYALDEISRSLKMAGYWGRNNSGGLVRGRTGATQSAELWVTTPATNDCTNGWYADVARRVEGLNNTNAPYSTTCLPDTRYQANTDVLVVRHVEPDAVATASLVANTAYIRSDPAGAQLFVGTTEPTGFTALAQNYQLRSEALYVSPFSLTVGDGIPTLKRAALIGGAVAPQIFLPAVPAANEIIIPGIENMQVQYGLDRNNDGSANQYVDANVVTANQWDDIVSIRIWLLVRSEATDGLYVNTSSYVLPETTVSPAGADGFRRLLMSRTIELRN